MRTLKEITDSLNVFNKYYYNDIKILIRDIRLDENLNKSLSENDISPEKCLCIQIPKGEPIKMHIDDTLAILNIGWRYETTINEYFLPINLN